jgi:two-component system, cell cycle sensor histidine kinase and response regulator CckA
MFVAAACAGTIFACLALCRARLQVRRARADATRVGQRFRAVFDSATVGISIGVDGRMVQTNRALQEMLGYSAAELSKLHFAALTHPDDVAEDMDQLNRLLAGEIDSYRVEKRYIRRDGELLWADVRVSLARDEQGRPAFGVGLTEDITKRKQLEEQLRQSQKMEAVGSLAGGVAHDFNNVLTAIAGYSEILFRELGDDDPRRKRVVEIQLASERASALTRQLLAFSRKQVLQPQLVDLNDVVTGIEPMLRRLIREDVGLEADRSAVPLTVLADPGQLDQVVLNLALNARDAMPWGGALRIRVGVVSLEPSEAEPLGLRPGRHCYLSVSDTGVGMDEETQRRVFEPFFTTKPAGKGTGLGLSTVYGIVRQSGGAVSIASTLGHGSVFTAYLPERLDPVRQTGTHAPVKTLAV